jgi:hypothetical protein
LAPIVAHGADGIAGPSCTQISAVDIQVGRQEVGHLGTQRESRHYIATRELLEAMTRAPQRSTAETPPIEGTVWNEDRTEIIGGTCYSRLEGWLSSLEIYSVIDDPIAVFPPLDVIDFERSN